MGKRSIFTIIFFSICLLSSVQGQESFYKIGYINTVELLDAIPEKVKASKNIEELNQKYKNELAIMQNEYNKKYSDFIADQNSMAESIKLRRMQELYELEKNIESFLKIAQEDVESQEELLIEPLRKKLNQAIKDVGEEHGFICIYDLAHPSIAFVTSSAIDANSLVKRKLSSK